MERSLCDQPLQLSCLSVLTAHPDRRRRTGRRHRRAGAGAAGPAGSGVRGRGRVNDMPRAATTHAATLEMLDGLGLVDEVIRRGLVEPLFRIWDRATGKLVAEFDFGMLKNDTRYPFAVQCEQHKLAAMAIERLRALPACRASNSPPACSRSNNSRDRVEIAVEDAARHAQDAPGCYLIGADGGRSTVRKALDIEFEGYTHPERFLILTTTVRHRHQVSGLHAQLPLRSGGLVRAVQGQRATTAAACGGCCPSTRPEQTDAELFERRSDRAPAAEVPSQGRPLRHRPPQSLQRAPAGGGELPQGPRVPRRRRRPRQQSARRPRPQLRHP